MNRNITRVKGSRFCTLEVKHEDGRLSICGTLGQAGGLGRSHDRVGTLPDGRGMFADSFGQIREELIEFFPEVTPYLKWHLNDMRAGCEHQRAMGWGTEDRKVEIVTYKLTGDACSEQRQLERRNLDALKLGQTVTLVPSEIAILSLPYWLKRAPDSEGAESGRYEVDKRETKSIGWLTQDEHSEGILSKPCPTCGYKYGSAWLREEIPQNVITFFENLE